MRKQIIKKLYTLYTVKGEFNDIINDHADNLVSYSAGSAECIVYHDTMLDWIDSIVSNKFQNGFGIKVLSLDEKESIEVFNNNLRINTITCNKKPINIIIKNVADMIDFYFNDDSFYYEIKRDAISIHTELTGHQNYGSPYESYNNCKNCDGARCDLCNKIYIVEDFNLDKTYYKGDDELEAKCVRDELKENYSDTILDILEHYKVDMDWFENEINGANDFNALLKILREYKIPHVIVD